MISYERNPSIIRYVLADTDGTNKHKVQELTLD